MIDRLAEILAQHYIGLSFVSKTAGAVQTLKKPIANGKTLKLPVARQVYKKGIGSMDVEGWFEVGAEVTCDTEQPYYELLPDTKETGILYFESLGARSASHNKRYSTFTGFLKLVCWLNLKKIGTDIEPYLLGEAVMANMPQEIEPDGYFMGAHLKVAQIAPKRPSPFDQYDLNEAQRQYITYPYDYFSFNIEYKVMVLNACASNIELNPNIC